jgi:hypothetical protein
LNVPIVVRRWAIGDWIFARISRKANDFRFFELWRWLGEFTVLDARLTAGVADPPSYATQWAAQLQQVPHTLIPSSGKPSPLGQLAWMRFRATLWLPAGWRLPPQLHAESIKCAE